MADIFISYKKEDAGRVVRIVEGLRAEGFSVWWDHGITPGAQWDQTIHNELNAAKAVIAIWSEQSVGAPWVKEEAGVGKNRGILLPIRIDDVDPPLGFSLIQMGDLIGWSGDIKDSHWQMVLAALRAIVSGERPQALEAPPRRRQRSALLVAILALILVVATALGALLYFNGAAQRQSAEAPGANIGSAPPIQAPSVETPPAGAPNASEQSAWDQAVAVQTRQAFQNYLVLYPNGAYASRARDVLLTCRMETREVWQPGRVGQVIRGVNATAAPSEVAACQVARDNARANGERACRSIAANDGYRNGEVSFTEAPCSCQRTPGGYICYADPAYSCSWEMRTQQQVEICGG
ncbi:MAG: TIR domain-containing protein [Hyphomonadaceae bacterium JAD_PAG50586_4]|nr:MAG: TIR domain-containing protein [Hyphomonadaceae bacterium JAD_PAG50586_4]